jgi:2-polyprenyl-3-methyl-5-hydroxy-6-metoxy-1,4-benzoquinol methylase
MTSHNQWEEFFDSHAPHYMQNPFTKNTLAEVDFLLEVLELAPGTSILDKGCGTGRHAIELAKRGYRVTGVDISSGMLAEAEKSAREANVIIEWIRSDATQFRATRQFDAAICLCEAAFGLLSTNEDPVEHDKAILRNISTALKPRGPFLLTTFNAIAKLRQLTQEDVDQGRFDPATMIEESDQELDLPEGKKTVHVIEHYYTPSELTWLLQQQGLAVEHIWGGTAGKWGRREINLDEIEVMVMARKIG